MTRRIFLKKESGDILQFAFKNTGNKMRINKLNLHTSNKNCENNYTEKGKCF